MTIDPTLTAKFAAESGDIGALRRAAQGNTPEGMKAVAKQFEALFMNMVLKSMRNATPQNGIFDNDQSRMYTSLLDQELSQHFAKRGIGLADAMLRQMTRNNSAFQKNPPPNQQASSATETRSSSSLIAPEASGPTARQQALALLRAYETGGPVTPAQPNVPLQSQQTKAALATSGSQKPHVLEFQQRFAASAAKASQTTGIPAQFMLGQAALESGWGKREIVSADGTHSHNLFGIKAGAGWKGRTVDVATTEYIHGKAQRRMEKFRAYASYDEAFQDYARLISTSPRYRNVMANSHDAVGFAQGLQRAGYATDPNYAAKLVRVIKQTTLA